MKTEFDSFDIYHSYGTTSSRGCAILISKKLNANIIDTKADQNGRYIFINLEIEITIYSIINIYAPNDQRLRNLFFNSIDSLLKVYSLGLKLIAGDYNQSLSQIDRITKNNNVHISNKPTTGLHKLIKSHNLIDIWRDTN